MCDFAKKTGDYKSLSLTDLKVIAVVYDLEKQHVGTDHIKTEPEKKVRSHYPVLMSSTLRLFISCSSHLGFMASLKSFTPKTHRNRWLLSEQGKFDAVLCMSTPSSDALLDFICWSFFHVT